VTWEKVAEPAVSCPLLRRGKLLLQIFVLLSSGDLTVHSVAVPESRSGDAPDPVEKMHLSDCKGLRLLQEGAESGKGVCFSSAFGKYSVA